MANSTEMLGLERQDADLRFIRENVIRKSLQTKQDALVLCMQYAKLFGQTGADIARRYGLYAHTLTDIAGGKVIRRGREGILRCLVKMLNDLRLVAACKGETLRVFEIQHAINDIAMVSFGLCPDAEIVERKEREQQVEWEEKAIREGVIKRSK